MQTKKRAKSVTFGGKKETPEEKKIVEEKDDAIEEVEDTKAESASKKEGDDSESKPKEKEHKKEEKPKGVDKNEANSDEKESEKNDRYRPIDYDEEPAEVNLTEESEEKVEEETDEEKAPKEKERPLSVAEKESEPVEERSPFGSFTKASEDDARKRGNTWFFIMVTFIAFIVGLACIAGIYYFTAGKDITKQIKLPNIVAKLTPSPTATPQPSPTPKTVDLSAYSVQVLNGSGTTGEAAKVKTELTTAGFTVSKTGNADNSDYTKTIIEAKKGTDEAFIKELIAELKKSYSIDANIETLKTSEVSDVIVIIGSTTAK